MQIRILRQSVCNRGCREFVSGIQKKEDGKNIVTSVIVKISEAGVHTASGSIYELGEVDPLYEKQYPNAKQRLMGGK